MAAAVVHSSLKRFTMLGHCCEGTRILQGAWGGPRGAARCSAGGHRPGTCAAALGRRAETMSEDTDDDKTALPD
jgi:hypothetical protein